MDAPFGLSCLMQTLAGDIGDVMPIGIVVVAVLWLVLATITKITQTHARERTKREIAAYVAEGSMTPEHGERLLRADMPHWERGGKA